MESARTKSFPYLFKYLHHDLFKDFTHVCNLSSICPGRTVGDPAVTDLRCIRHTPDKTISFKLSHTNEPYTFLKLKPIQLGWNKGTTTAVLQLSEIQEGEIAAPPFSESRDPSGLSSSL